MSLNKQARDFADIQEIIRQSDIQMIDLKFTDLSGRWRHVTLPARTLDSRVFTEGIGFDGSSVSSFQRVESGDLCLIPEPATCFRDPFFERPTLSMMCAIVDAENRQQFEGDPRFIARKAEAYIQDLGLGIGKALFSPELEFHILDHVAFADEPNHSFYFADSREASWQSGRRDGVNLGATIPHKSGYHAIQPRDSLSDLRAEIVMMIQDLGIPVKYHHHEVGAPGQVEIEVLFNSLVHSADSVMLMKYVIRNLAHKRGAAVTFMPKPFYGEAGNGMHFHQFLVGQSGEPIFFDEADPYAQLSTMAYAYIAGILDHGRAICAFTNCSTNSYRRLVPGFEAPTNLFFCLGNRSAAIRIPKYAPTPDVKRIEFRTPDGCGNIYLNLAAQLMAGIDGVLRRLDPRTIPGMGPFDVNIGNERAGDLPPIVPVPASLGEALKALESDQEFLKAGTVFPAEFIKAWIKGKQLFEIEAVERRPTPFEYRLYFDL